MNRETAKQAIKERISCKDFLFPSASGLFRCPFCGSGTGENKTGALKYYEDTNTFHCFKCGKTGDVIDLFQEAYKCEYNEALSLLAEQIGTTIENYSPAVPRPEKTEKQEEAQAADYTEYYKECRKRLADPEALAYLSKRGISKETAEAYWIGYDPAADPATAPGATGPEQKRNPCKRIIIPTSTGHYIARSIEEKTEKQFAKMNPARSKGATGPAIFNSKALKEQDIKEIFITEGAFDALSIIEAGAPAIALNSTANAEKLLKLLSEEKTEATLILSLDNDEAGKKAAEKLREGLKALNIPFYEANICGTSKDPNEALTTDRKAFFEAVERARRGATTKPDNTSYYIDSLMKQEIERFRTETKTGFPDFDSKTGGLYPGLYALAAISSLGKTSFALQLADKLAAGGKEVLFFSLEQSRLELVSKSLARYDYELKQDSESAYTSLEIRKGKGGSDIVKAAETYKQTIQDRVSIIEGNFGANVSFIGNKIKEYIDRNNSRPVVFVDYLQILQPGEKDAKTQREFLDSAITELKRISRDLDITLFVISSVNRDSYLNQIDFESLKGTGSIEYTCDVVLGLQLSCLKALNSNQPEDRREAIRRAKAATPRKIELVCLKNRYGVSNFSCEFDYYPANDYFKETTASEKWAEKPPVLKPTKKK